MKYLNALILSCLLIVGHRAAAMLAPIGTVTIPDPKLAAVLRAALNKPSGPLTTTDLAQITFFVAEWQGITNLTGMQAAVNATHLGLSGNEISDITPLLGLKNLQALYLNNNALTNVAGIGALQSLDTLGLAGWGVQSVSEPIGIADLSPLSGLTNLVELSVSGNPLTGLAFSNLPSLGVLEMSDCGLTNISCVVNFPTLWSLNLNVNRLTDVSPLAALTNLTMLSLHENLVSDITPLNALSLSSFFLLTVAYNNIDLNRESPNRQTLAQFISEGCIVEHGGQTYSPRLRIVVTNYNPTPPTGYLEFDGDAWSIYAVESSTNLTTWTEDTQIHALSLQPTQMALTMEGTRYFRLHRTQTGVPLTEPRADAPSLSVAITQEMARRREARGIKLRF